MARAASRAMLSVVAETTATSVPAHWISVPGGEMTRTPVTPFIFSAALVSTLFTFACAWGDVSSTACRSPGGFRSDEYFALPLALAVPSRRLVRLPITRRLSIGGQL